MNTLPAQEIKRRGVKAIELALKDGPVHIIKNNSPACVVLTEAQYMDLKASHLPKKMNQGTVLQWLLQKRTSNHKTREELDKRLTLERDKWDR